MNGILEYSIQLAMLRQLLNGKLINKQEYFKIKKLWLLLIISVLYYKKD